MPIVVWLQRVLVLIFLLVMQVETPAHRMKPPMFRADSTPVSLIQRIPPRHAQREVCCYGDFQFLYTYLLTYFVFGGEEGHGESAPMDVEVRGHFQGVCLFFLPCESQGWNSSPQAWQPIRLPFVKILSLSKLTIKITDHSGPIIFLL